MENLNYLQKFESKELTLADASAIYKSTGYDITLPEQYNHFKKVAAAMLRLKQTPNYMSLIRVSDMQSIIDGDCCLTIMNVKKFLGNKYIQAMLGLAITDFCDMLNINKNMSPEQIAFCVDCLINEYPYNTLTLADVKLILKNLYFGKYGKIYDRIDPNVILDAVNTYFNDRVELAEQKSYYEHLNHKPETRNL